MQSRRRVAGPAALGFIPLGVILVISCLTLGCPAPMVLPGEPVGGELPIVTRTEPPVGSILRINHQIQFDFVQRVDVLDAELRVFALSQGDVDWQEVPAVFTLNDLGNGIRVDPGEGLWPYGVELEIAILGLRVMGSPEQSDLIRRFTVVQAPNVCERTRRILTGAFVEGDSVIFPASSSPYRILVQASEGSVDPNLSVISFDPPELASPYKFSPEPSQSILAIDVLLQEGQTYTAIIDLLVVRDSDGCLVKTADPLTQTITVESS